jgi:hypothetical protein
MASMSHDQSATSNLVERFLILFPNRLPAATGLSLHGSDPDRYERILNKAAMTPPTNNPEQNKDGSDYCYR